MSFTATNEFGNRIKKGEQIGLGANALVFDSIVSLSRVNVIDRTGNKISTNAAKLKITIR